ncbi:MAG: molecular chaperone TorD family protein [Epsilonproteobacteria bacterium]|nr:molecular chaperone TorD family protein [Campylobacterota bacterium]
MQNKEINEGRAFYYGFFSKLFTFTYDKERFAGVKKAAEILHNYALEENSKKALQHFIEHYDEKTLSDEYDEIFYDLSQDPVPTTASFYDEEIENGKMKVKMVDIVLGSKFRKNEEYKDSEDDIGFIFPFMQYLILEKLNGDEKSEWLEGKTFDVLNTFIDDFAENVYMHQASYLYKDIAVVLKAFIESERIFLEKPKPVIEKIKKEVCEVCIADEEAALRKKRKKKESDNLVCNLEEGGDVEDEV